jgi:hypothetical protein
MPEEPKLESEDLPEQEHQLNEKDLDAIRGGTRGNSTIPLKPNFGPRRSADPCEGGQLT